jgi:hypothetical protein
MGRNLDGGEEDGRCRLWSGRKLFCKAENQQKSPPWEFSGWIFSAAWVKIFLQAGTLPTGKERSDKADKDLAAQCGCLRQQERAVGGCRGLKQDCRWVGFASTCNAFKVGFPSEKQQTASRPFAELQPPTFSNFTYLTYPNHFLSLPHINIIGPSCLLFPILLPGQINLSCTSPKRQFPSASC